MSATAHQERATRPTRSAVAAGWHREEIKAALRMRGLTLAALGAREGYSASAIKAALDRPYPAIERLIADELGVAPWELWPDRYTRGPSPQPRMGWRRWQRAQQGDA